MRSSSISATIDAIWQPLKRPNSPPSLRPLKDKINSRIKKEIVKSHVSAVKTRDSPTAYISLRRIALLDENLIQRFRSALITSLTILETLA